MNTEHSVVRALKMRQRHHSRQDGNFIYLTLTPPKRFADVEHGIIGALQALQLKSFFDYIADKRQNYAYPNFTKLIDDINAPILSIEVRFEELGWVDSIFKVFQDKTNLITYSNQSESIALIVKIYVPKHYSELEKVKLGVKAISDLFNYPEPYVTKISGSYAVLPSQ
jgi:hypothetical protein